MNSYLDWYLKLQDDYAWLGEEVVPLDLAFAICQTCCRQTSGKPGMRT
jgi:hypothetical protein